MSLIKNNKLCVWKLSICFRLPQKCSKILTISPSTLVKTDNVHYIFLRCHKSATKSWQWHSLWMSITFDWLAQKCYKNMTMSPLMNVHYILWVATTVSQNISWQCHYICYKKCKEECLVIFYPFAISSQNHDNVTNLQKEVNSFIVRKATIVPLFRLGDTFVATQEFR